MFVSQPLRPTQSDPVDDGGVVQLIGQHGIIWTQQNLEQSGVGIETAGVQDAVLPLVKLCQLLLQMFVQVLNTERDSVVNAATYVLLSTRLS